MRMNHIFVFLLCIFLLFAFTSCTTESTINTSPQTSSQACSTNYQESLKDSTLKEDKNHYYYITETGIFKENKTSGEATLLKQKTSEDETLKDINIVDGWIYYFVYLDNPDFEIYRMDMDGNHLEKVLTNLMFTNGNEYLHGYTFINDKIYIQMSFCFYCFDISTRQIEKLFDDVGIYQIVNDRLYFIDHANRTFTIYVADLKSKELKILLGDGIYNPNKEEAKNLYKNFIFIDDMMYYYMRKPNGLYCYKNGESKLIDDDADIHEFSLFQHQNKLYFTESGEKTDK